MTTTKRTDAYRDYTVRMREVVALLNLGREASEPHIASACSKGAVVLGAAALERYMNDLVGHTCRALKVDTWESLPDGHRKYMCRQIASRLLKTSQSVLRNPEHREREERRLRRTVAECADALTDPSTWSHIREFGVFMDSAAAPDKVSATLKAFQTEGADPFASLDELSTGRAPFLHGLSELVAARHAAAHGLPDPPSPSPRDAQAWVVLSFWMVRRLDLYVVKDLAQVAPGDSGAAA